MLLTVVIPWRKWVSLLFWEGAVSINMCWSYRWLIEPSLSNCLCDITFELVYLLHKFWLSIFESCSLFLYDLLAVNTDTSLRCLYNTLWSKVANISDIDINCSCHEANLWSIKIALLTSCDKVVLLVGYHVFKSSSLCLNIFDILMSALKYFKWTLFILKQNVLALS